MMRLSIAFRNLWRNKLRTILILFMVSLGVTAISLFEGFSHNALKQMEIVAINDEYGNIQVAQDNFWSPNASESSKDRMMAFDPASASKMAALPGVVSASGRINFSGMISNGESSTTGFGIGFDIDREVLLRDGLKIVQGKTLGSEDKFKVLLGPGLSKALKANVGQTVSLLAYTLDGMANALDFEVAGIFETGNDRFDQTSFFLPLAALQNLMNTDRVDSVVLHLRNDSMTDGIVHQLEQTLPKGYSTRTWFQLAKWYQQVYDYLRVQNSIVFGIIALLIILSISNVIGMSIQERIGEIGTIRALGNSRLDVLIQFTLEGLLIGVFGGMLGCVMGPLAGQFVEACKIMINPPGTSVLVPIQVDIVLKVYLESLALTCVTALAASVLPAYRASRLNVIEALKHNI